MLNPLSGFQFPPCGSRLHGPARRGRRRELLRMGAGHISYPAGGAQKRTPEGQHRKPRRLARFLARFTRDREAAAAIEFSIVAVPFCALLFALIETTTVFFANGVLDNAVQETSRMIRTGRVQAGGFTEEQFRTEVCNQINVILACDARLKIDVRTFSQFNNVAFSSPLDANGDFAGSFQFSPGAPGDVVLVRVFYAWDVMTPGLGAFLENMSGGKRLLQSSAAFRNEPFGALLAG